MLQLNLLHKFLSLYSICVCFYSINENRLSYSYNACPDILKSRSNTMYREALNHQGVVQLYRLYFFFFFFAESSSSGNVTSCEFLVGVLRSNILTHWLALTFPPWSGLWDWLVDADVAWLMHGEVQVTWDKQNLLYNVM